MPKTLFVLLTVMLSGCHPSDQSLLKKRPDPIDNPRKMGIKGTIDFARIDERSQFAGQVPWKDSYWPLYRMGISARWLSGGIPFKDPDGIPNLKKFIEDYFDAFREEDDDRIALLSPGEKYAMLKHHRIIDELDKSATLFRIKKRISKLYDSLPKDATTFEEKRDKAKKIYQFLLDERDYEGNLYKTHFLVWESWKTFFEYASGAADGGDTKYSLDGSNDEGEGLTGWGWMGHCHGWSAASTAEEEPLHAVMAKVGQRKILMTEGDIRGLITKAWANLAPYNSARHPNQTWFIGGRCNIPQDKIPVGSEDRRTLGGIYCEGSCDRDMLKNKWYSDKKIFAKTMGDQSFIAVRYNLYEKPKKVGGKMIAKPLNKTIYTLPYSRHDGRYTFAGFENVDNYRIVSSPEGLDSLVFESREELHAFLENPDPSGVTSYRFRDAKCRDVNPATVHLALSEYLNDGKEGRQIVIDQTPSAHVWNQSVFSYKSDIGSLVDVTKLDFVDPLLENRAPGTRYISMVSTDITFQVEPRLPSITYTSSDGRDLDEDPVTTITTHYTLEFDRKKRLIGGEWGHVSESGVTNFSPEDNRPDFIFAYKKEGLKPGRFKNIPFDVIFLRRIQECAQDTSDLKTTRIGGKRIRYADCEMYPQ